MACHFGSFRWTWVSQFHILGFIFILQGSPYFHEGFDTDEVLTLPFRFCDCAVFFFFPLLRFPKGGVDGKGAGTVQQGIVEVVALKGPVDSREFRLRVFGNIRHGIGLLFG